MSNEELAIRIQEGECDLLCELWGQVEKFVSMQAGKVSRALRGYVAADYDDLYQSGYLALVEAVESFQEDKQVPFITWFAYYLKTAFAVATGYRSEKDKASPLRFAKSLDAPLVEDADMSLEDTVQDPRDPFEEAEQAIWLEQLRAELHKALSTLPSKEQAILERRYWKEASLREIGETMGLQANRVRLVEQKALRKLRHPRTAKPLRAFIEERTNYYRHVGVDAFQRLRSSSVELEAIRREALRDYDTRGGVEHGKEAK